MHEFLKTVLTHEMSGLVEAPPLSAHATRQQKHNICTLLQSVYKYSCRCLKWGWWGWGWGGGVWTTHEGRVDGVHEALLVQGQQLLGQLVAGGPHQRTHCVGQLQHNQILMQQLVD